jgi:tRNA dimethylallyltransferase
MPGTTDEPPVVAVVGPTASGKSELSLEIAERISGEIVNTDSMQLYAGMDIGTAKLPPGRRRGVPHHLLDVLDVAQTATVAEFQRLARRTVEECRGRGVAPVLVGGSALYTRAVLDRFDFPGTDPVVRARLEGELAARGPHALHRRLSERDPAAASRIIETNGRRIVRALEVLELTGRRFSGTLPSMAYHYTGAHQIGVDVPRDVLDERIALRVESMWRAGFVGEVRALEKRGLATGRTASRALGYRQVLAFLAGEITEEEAWWSTVRATRRFARRQDAWFKKDPRVRWVSFEDPDRVAKAVSWLDW